MSKNDEIIVKYQEEIAKREEALGKAGRSTWVTNSNILVDGVKVNIQTLATIEDCVLILAFLKSRDYFYKQSAKELGVETAEEKYSGFTTREWTEDLKTQVIKIEQREERAKLAKLKKKLEALESEDLKVSKTLKDIAAELG